MGGINYFISCKKEHERIYTAVMSKSEHFHIYFKKCSRNTKFKYQKYIFKIKVGGCIGKRCTA